MKRALMLAATPQAARGAAWLHAGARAAGLFAAVIGTLVLLGWFLQIRVLMQVFPGIAAMAPNAAVGLLLAGLSLWLQTGTTAESRLRGARVAAVAAGLLGLLTFAEYVSGTDLGIDEILFRDTAGLSRPFPGRMAGAAALCFVTLAPALVLTSLRRAPWLAELLAMIVGLLALLALTGYAYGAQGLSSIGLYKGMAVHAALALFALALGVLLVCAGSFSRLIVSDTAGGVVARWFLPVALGVPFLLGWLRLVGQQAGLYGTEFGGALYAVSDTVVLIAILWAVASPLMRTGEEWQRSATSFARQKELLDALLEALVDGVVVADTSGRFLVFNPAAEQILGIGAVEDGPQGWSSAYGLFRPDTGALFPQEQLPLSRALRGEAADDVMLFVRNARVPEGILISASARPMVDSAGRVFAGVAVFRDVTGVRRVEEELRRSEVRFRSLVTATSQMVWSTDREGRVTAPIPTWQAYTGQTDEEIMGSGWGGALHPDDLQPALAVWTHAVETKTPYDVEYRIRGRDGVYRHFSARGVPILADDGAIREWVGTCTDITERKRAERELSERAEELARSNKELEHFAYVASHDLQEPLRMVSSYTELLGRRYKGKLDADADEFIAYAVEGATRMQAMINDLLAYARLGSKGWSVAPVDCHLVLARALSNLGSAIDESHALVTSDPLPTVPASETELTQLLQNLIANAIKFRSERPPVVHVSARRSGAEWVFSVRDNGIGIAPEHCERIFVIFQRLNARDRYSGTGIGLAICKKVVERHGGRIWVESEPGGGSTFFFTIPEKERATP